MHVYVFLMDGSKQMVCSSAHLRGLFSHNLGTVLVQDDQRRQSGKCFRSRVRAANNPPQSFHFTSLADTL